MNYKKMYMETKKAIVERMPHLAEVYRLTEDYYGEQEEAEATNKALPAEVEPEPEETAYKHEKSMVDMAANARRIK